MTASRRERARQVLLASWRRLRGGELRPERAAASVAVGIFVGFVPLYGVQTLVCLAMTVPLRLDFPLAWAATNVANPLTAPFIILLDIEVGAFLVRGEWLPLSTRELTLSNLGPFFLYALLGGLLLGAIGGAIGGSATLYGMRRAARARAARSSPEA